MYHRASHKVKPGAIQHPLQNASLDLARASPELFAIWKRVHEQARSMGKQTPSLVPADLVDWCKKNGIYDNLKKKVQTFQAKEIEARKGLKDLNLKPPRSGELYERFKPGIDLQDVGSGDGKRVARYQGYFGKVKCFEKLPKKKMVQDFPSDWHVCYGDKLQILSETAVSTFLSYTQLEAEDKAVVDNSDGIHIVPNHDALAKFGVVEMLENGKVKTQMGKHTFVENYQKYIGQELSNFYCGFNTFRQRDLNLVPKARGKFSVPESRNFTRMRRDLYISDFTKKYDGSFVELNIEKGKFVLKNNLGDGCWGEVDGPDLALQLEAMKDCYRLLRVKFYKDYRPFHSLDMLELFARKVKIRIGGKSIEPPEKVDIKTYDCCNDPDSDGVVCRSGGHDYVMNCGVHLDLKKMNLARLEEFLRDKQGVLKTRHSGIDKKHDGVYAVCVRIRTSGVAHCLWKARKDKTTCDEPNWWDYKFKLLTLEGYQSKFHGKRSKGGFEYDDDDGTDE